MADSQGPPSATEVRQAAREILSRPEFQPPTRSPAQVVMDWIGRQLDRIFTPAAGSGNIIGYLVAAVAVAAIIVLLVRFARSVQSDPATDVTVDPDVGRPATDWAAEALAHEATGEWRQALRCRYRAMVADLAGRGLIDEVPGRTTGEYRAAVVDAVPGAASEFSGATELFERAWYGDKPTGPADADRFRELSERVLVGAGR